MIASMSDETRAAFSGRLGGAALSGTSGPNATLQLRYVVVAPNQGKAPIVIPWQALYFDSTRVRLVYYTFS